MPSVLLNTADRRMALLPKALFPGAVLLMELERYVGTLVARPAFIITTKKINGERRADIAARLEADAASHFYLETEPTEEDVSRCLDIVRASGPAFILAVGGGSVLDLAKLVARDLSLALVVAPTTPGTGSEATPYAVLTSAEKKKVVTVDADLLPEVVVLDSTLLASLPRLALAYSVIDSVSHSIEALCSRMYQPMVADAARTGVREIKLALSEPASAERLRRWQMAGFWGGLAQGMAGTGLTHSLAHYFGPRFNLSHGLAVSVFLLPVIKLNSRHAAIEERLAQADLTVSGAGAVVSAIKEFFEVPETKLNVDGFDMEDCLDNVLRDVCTLTNPFKPTREQVQELVLPLLTKVHSNG